MNVSWRVIYLPIVKASLRVELFEKLIAVANYFSRTQF